MHSELQWKKNRGEERGRKEKLKPAQLLTWEQLYIRHSELESLLLTKSNARGLLAEVKVVKKKS